MVEATFDACVSLLAFLADMLGMTYEAINIWIFVIIWPVFTLVLVATVMLQQVKIRRLLGTVDVGERNPQK